jgi:hypothetical protein
VFAPDALECHHSPAKVHLCQSQDSDRCATIGTILSASLSYLTGFRSLELFSGLPEDLVHGGLS